MNSSLQLLRTTYSSDTGTHSRLHKLRKLRDKYIKNNESALLDAMAATAALGGIVYSDQIDYDEITPQMEEAFQLSFPKLTFEDLESMSTEQLEGIVSAWKGKYFEVLVRDKLNAGEYVGDLHLEPGQEAVLAEHSNQPDWDLQILNSDGTVVDAVQLKASESLSYVKDALEKYPDTEVYTTEELEPVLMDKMHSTGVSNSELENSITAPMEDLMDSTLENIGEALIPGLPFVLIAVGEGRHVLSGKKSFEAALGNSIERSAKTGVAFGAGALAAFALDMGIVSLPVTFLARMGMSRWENKGAIIEHYKSQNENLLGLAEDYNY